MRISDWSSDVCSSDLHSKGLSVTISGTCCEYARSLRATCNVVSASSTCMSKRPERSEEHTSELQSLMRISYAVFCLKKKNIYSYLFHHNQYYMRNSRI